MAGTRGGVQYAAQLARVTERRPRVATIRSSGQQQLRLVVKVRPCLVQYIVNGVVMCVITSLEPITDVVDLVRERSADADAETAQILLAVADGAIWRVTLPTKPLGVLHQVLLQQKSAQRMALSSIESVDTPTQVLGLMEDDPFTTQNTAAAEAAERGVACCVELFYQVPGVQFVLQRGDCTVCTSMIAPSTLLWTSSSGDLTAQKPSDIVSAIELEELEAEQSTCVVAFRGHDEAGQALLGWLFANEEAAHYTEPSSLVLLQGDIDGVIRYYVTNQQGKKAATEALAPPPPRSGKLLEIGQPVQFIVPFSISSVSFDVKKGINSSRSHGLLVIGHNGHARLLLLLPSQDSRDDPSASHSGIPIAFDAPVQSIVFDEALDCFLYCSNGAVYGFRASDLIHQRSSSDNNSSSKRAVSPRTDFSVKLPFVSGVVSIALHEDSQGISLVYASGRVVSMDQKHLDNAVAHVLPRLQAQEEDQDAFGIHVPSSLPSLSSEDTNESRIKSLLQRISHVSTSSTKLRTQSEQLDAHLRNLHAALLIQKHVAAHGIHSLFHYKLDLLLVSTGSFLHKKAVKLTCRIDANKLDFISSLSCWLVSIHVRSQKQLVTTFVLPLQDVLHSPSRGHEAREMVLYDDTLEYQDDSGGVLFVSCSLVFQPGHIFQDREQKHQAVKKESGVVVAESSNSRDSGNSLFSFVLPLVQDKAFHLVQLSELLDGDSIPTSHMAIKAAFRQDHDPSLPSPSLLNHSSNNGSQPGLLLQGFQLWSALAAHWEDKSFAALWLRDMQTTKNSQQPHELDIAPPSRFTMVFPAFAVQELTMDHVVAIVRSVLNFPVSMNTKLHESCRSQSGKFWIGLKTFAGNLVVLRFSLAEGTILIDGEMLRPLEILLQCSSAEDLSVMRALLVASVPRYPGHEEMSMPLDEVFSALSLEAAEFRDALFEAEALAGVIAEKISTSLKSSESSLCTDEVVRMLADVARVETQTLELYWKSRQVLNKFVI